MSRCLRNITSSSLKLKRASAPGVKPKRAFAFRSTLHHQLSTFLGGIAQLVERQLCKLEVRGSNPLASKMKFRRQHKSKGESTDRGGAIPLPPVYARSAAKSVDCRAETLVKADVF